MNKNRTPLLTGIILLAIAILMQAIQCYYFIDLILLGILGCFLVTILEAREQKIPKGIKLIIFGVSFEILFPNSQFVGHLPQDSIDKIQIIKNIALFVCAGAGGSIIATHAEKFLHKTEENEKPKLVYIDNTRKNEEIIREIYQIKKYGLMISTFIIIALLIIILIIV